MRPTEEMPEVEAGDRVAIIVRERQSARGPFSLRLVILEATETGWYSADSFYAGYTPDDGELWSTEKDICAIAGIIG